MDSGTLKAYNAQSAKLTRSYESANLSSIHALLVRQLPPVSPEIGMSATRHNPTALHPPSSPPL